MYRYGVEVLVANSGAVFTEIHSLFDYVFSFFDVIYFFKFLEHISDQYGEQGHWSQPHFRREEFLSSIACFTSGRYPWINEDTKRAHIIIRYASVIMAHSSTHTHFLPFSIYKFARSHK